MSGEVRECWINVYERSDGHQVIGGGYEKHQVEAWAKPNGVFQNGLRSAYRYHVRLKPEGAPKRYASESERRAWELDAASARFAAQHGFSLRNRVGSGVYMIPARTLKTEESAS